MKAVLNAMADLFEVEVASVLLAILSLDERKN